MEKARLENLCWYCSGCDLGRCKYRIPVTKCWDTQGEWRVPKRCWKRKKIHCCEPAQTIRHMVLLEQGWLGLPRTLVETCVHLYVLCSLSLEWLVDTAEGVTCSSQWGERRNKSHCLKITCFRYTLQGSVGGNWQWVNGLYCIGKNYLGVSWGQKIKLKTLIPLQDNPYTICCFIAKHFFHTTMLEV